MPAAAAPFVITGNNLKLLALITLKLKLVLYLKAIKTISRLDAYAHAGSASFFAPTVGGFCSLSNFLMIINNSALVKPAIDKARSVGIWDAGEVIIECEEESRSNRE